MPDPVVRLRSLHLRLTGAVGAVNILRDVSLDVEAGCHLAVVGPSGSGKSSLLALTAGLERPSAGTVAITGQSLAALDEDALATFRGRTIGIVFQSFHLIATMTALENVALPLELAGDADAMKKARRMLAQTGLEARSGHLPAELSGGEQQRVALARALVNRPPLLLADEPTGNLDSGTGSAITDLLFDVVGQAGATLMLVTHNHDLARRCQRMVAIENGACSEVT